MLVLEAGRPDYRADVLIHMPAALTMPIGNRFYDWKYESEPEPYMNNRRIYHARGKVLGGSSSINGMIFQRGNPLDYERWAGRPGHADLGLRPLPALLQADGELPGRRQPTIRSAATPARSCSSGARRPTRCSRRSSAAAEQAGYPRTSDVNGYRQEGFAKFDRNISHGRRLSAARAYLHPVMHRPNLEVTTRAFVHRLLFEGKRVVGVEYTQGSGNLDTAFGGTVVLVRRRVQHPAAAAAVGHRQRGRAAPARGQGRARPARRR